MSRECANAGGPHSIIRLDTVPALEVELTQSAGVVAALAAWDSRPGEIVTVVDPEQSHYRARIVDITGESARLIPFERFPRSVESPVSIEVYQALPEKERFELVLQKLTEIGVARIVPFTSGRSSTLEARDAGQRKSHRWPEVILRAGRQCRRAMLPELSPVLDWDGATYEASRAGLKLMLFEGEAPWSLGEALRDGRPSRIALMVGPEGGFDPEEVEDARSLGFLPVSIGPRILRTETAAILGAAMIQYELGDLG